MLYAYTLIRAPALALTFALALSLSLSLTLPLAPSAQKRWHDTRVCVRHAISPPSSPSPSPIQLRARGRDGKMRANMHVAPSRLVCAPALSLPLPCSPGHVEGTARRAQPCALRHLFLVHTLTLSLSLPTHQLQVCRRDRTTRTFARIVLSHPHSRPRPHPHPLTEREEETTQLVQTCASCVVWFSFSPTPSPSPSPPAPSRRRMTTRRTRSPVSRCHSCHSRPHLHPRPLCIPHPSPQLRVSDERQHDSDTHDRARRVVVRVVPARPRPPSPSSTHCKEETTQHSQVCVRCVVSPSFSFLLSFSPVPLPSPTPSLRVGHNE